MILPYWTFISLVHLVKNTFHVDGEGYDMIDEEEDYERNIDNKVGRQTEHVIHHHC